MIFGPIKEGRGGGHFSTSLTPPHSLKTSKKWVSSGGSGGVRTNNSLGDAFIGQINVFTGVEQTIQPLEVGYTARPKKARKGGVFPYIRACLALI